MSFKPLSILTMLSMGLAAAVLLAACGGNGDDGPDGETTAPKASATSAPASNTVTPGTGAGGPGTPPAPPGFPTADEPPVTTATVNGQSVETGVGTYCWTRMCVDKIGVPTRGTLTVSAGDTVSVTIPNDAPPLREAGANVFEALDPMLLDDGSEIWPYPGALGEDVAYTVGGGSVDVTVDLMPGRHVLAVSMYFEAGDVVYGVLLEVQ